MAHSLLKASAHPDDPFDWLLDCHVRIRRFSELAERLANEAAQPGEDDGVAEAAARVLRYFTVALPLHAEDEDQELERLLRGHAVDAQVGEALDQLRREHQEIVQLIGALAPLWEGVVQQPAQLRAHQAGLREPTQRLVELFRRHLELEEKLLFPAAQQLFTAAERAELVRLMRARRTAQAQ